MILETVAKVRSCVVMLDLECEALIAEMFTLFLGNIRDFHKENIFTSMETIMTLVLDESEDISSEVLNPLLACMKKDNQEVHPVAVKLAEKVFEKCSSKLKPYLSGAIKSLGTSLDDYSEVVTAVCEGPSSTVEQMNENTSTDQSVVKTITGAMNADHKDPRPPNSTNGGNDNENENRGKSLKVVSSVNVEEQDLDNEPSADKSASKSEDGESEPRKPLKFESEVVDKPISSMNASESSDTSHVDGAKEVKNQSDPQENPEKDLHDSSREDDALHPSKSSYTDTVKNISSPKGSETDVANTSSPSQSGSLHDENHPKNAEQHVNKVNSHQEDTPSLGVVSEGTRDSEAKQHRRSKKKQPLQTSKKADEDTSQNESGGESGSEKKQSKQLGKKVDESSDPMDHSLKRKIESKIRQKAILESEANSKKTQSTKTSSKVPKTEENARTPSKRKPAASQQKVTGNVTYDDSLVGSKVKVWWPQDRAYYDGVIESFDSAKKKHKVVYNDGDVETLNLKRERWEIINDDSVSSEGHASEETASVEAASPLPKRERAKTDPEVSVKRGKAEASPKSKLQGTKSKDRPRKSDGKTDDNIGGSKSLSQRASDKHVDNSSKRSKDADSRVMSKGKSKQQDSPRTGSKSKQEISKIGSKSSKQEATSKTGVKSKSKTPQAADDGNANGLGKVKHSSSKTKEAAGESKEKFKEKSSADVQKTPDGAKVRSSEKLQEFEGGGSKKRRRAG
ncbi:OLC1v1027919C2 [Oldenlandia corymbosa var. corymbosa]|nr:OLC1v1027919C2 [Oldenlandia corymbosa var. corymbosa]